MSGVDEKNPSNGIQNHPYPSRPPLPPRPWGPRAQQSETQLSPLRMRGSAAAQLPQDEHNPRRRNRPKKSEAKVPTSAASSDDAMFEQDSVNRPTFKTNIVTSASPDIGELSFGNGPFRRLCMGLWEQLDNAMRQRERAIEDKEIEIAHNLSLLKAQSEVIAKERLQVEKLRQEADSLREQAMKQTKQLENQLAQLKKMQLHSGHNMARVLADKEESNRIDACEGATMPSEKIPESADCELNELVAKEPINNCLTMPLLTNTPDTSKNQGAATNLEEEAQCVKVSSSLSEISSDTHPYLQEIAGSLPKVKVEPADESSTPSQRCLKEGNALMSTALPEITVFLDIDPSLCENKYEIKIMKTDDEADPCANLEDVPLSKRRKLLQSNTFRYKKKAEGEQLTIPGKVAAGSRNWATKKRLTTLLPSALADYVRAEEKRKFVSMESALQEDAPGLLEALRENGLYEDVQAIGTVWEDDSVELRHQNEDFEELEGVMSKLWGPCSGLFKEGRARLQQTNNGNKPSYCMPCLVSLIEQTRAFRQRKWPVKWGWCRQLCAFLFVFENHNRIVLERPEYGYATYFFELVQELPVRWQAQRVIKVMSVTNNCRAALVENRALEVGMDLLEEEAAILEDYGWIPNSGIGSLLNFCDRVSHDYKSDEMIDWRSKIGKLLMDGHDHGRIISRMPRKFQGKNVDIVESSTNPDCDDKAIGGANTTVLDDGIYAIIKQEQ